MKAKFIKFSHIEYECEPIFLMNSSDIDICEDSEHSIVLKEGFFDYKFSFYKFYGGMRRMRLKQKLYDLCSPVAIHGRV